MGNPFLLQACLRLDAKELPKKLALGKKYHFFKQGHRLYQIKVPMDLRTRDWKALGRCVITEYTVGEGRTEGTFVMVQLFGKAQAQHVTNTFVDDATVERVLKRAK